MCHYDTRSDNSLIFTVYTLLKAYYISILSIRKQSQVPGARCIHVYGGGSAASYIHIGYTSRARYPRPGAVCVNEPSKPDANSCLWGALPRIDTMESLSGLRQSKPRTSFLDIKYESQPFRVNWRWKQDRLASLRMKRIIRIYPYIMSALNPSSSSIKSVEMTKSLHRLLTAFVKFYILPKNTESHNWKDWLHLFLKIKLI